MKIDKSTKKILIVAAVGIGALYLLSRNRNNSAGDPTGYGAMAGMFGDAITKVNQTLNEGLGIIFESGSRNAVNRAAETYREIDDYHAKSALYSKRNYF